MLIRRHKRQVIKPIEAVSAPVAEKPAEAKKPGTQDAVAVNYSSMSYQEIQALASDKGINPVGVKKADLIKALKATD